MVNFFIHLEFLETVRRDLAIVFLIKLVNCAITTSLLIILYFSLVTKCCVYVGLYCADAPFINFVISPYWLYAVILFYSKI